MPGFRTAAWIATASTTLAAFLILTVAGCKKNTPATAPEKPIAYTQIDPATAGTITGTIQFSGVPPKRILIDMAQDPACAYSGKGPNYTEQYVVQNGKMANVFIYVKDGLGNRVYAPSTTPVVLDQKGCRYIPHVIGVMAGQPVEFRNSDPTMHNVHPAPTTPGNQEFDISQPPMDGTQQHAFAKPELMIPVRCNNHPWMEAFINVAANPFFAVSGTDGHFEIQGLPPGTYTIEAVQEKLGSKFMQVTVPAKGTAQANFTFSE
jgi:plastocyanin